MSYQTSVGFLWPPSSELKKEEKKQHVYHVEVTDDVEEAHSVWRSILKRKGLPLDTPYEYVDTIDKACDESLCDMLYLAISKKKKNPQATNFWPTPWSSSSMTESNHCEVTKEEAHSVWRSILKRKGLPLDTPYEYVDTIDKACDGSFCDLLYLSIEKKMNPEAAKLWGRSSFEWLPPPASPTGTLSKLSSTSVFDFDKKKFERIIARRPINHIVYHHGSEAANRRSQLSLDTARKNRELQPPVVVIFNFRP